MVFTSAYLLDLASVIADIHLTYPFLPATIGGLIGAHFAILTRIGRARLWRSPNTSLNVVITGGTRGIGKAMAREFMLAGDHVLITSRDQASLDAAMRNLRTYVPSGRVSGQVCDISDPDSVASLADAAARKFPKVDVWINNAGYSGSFKPFVEHSAKSIATVVRTNLQGTLLCTRKAMQLISQQGSPGHVFNMDGAGADGSPTPQYAAYGATKSGVAHLSTSLLAEQGRQARKLVKLHTLSPGMVLTDLLLENSTVATKQVFNILCEQPETVAAYLVTRVRTVAARKLTGSYIQYLTPAKAIGRFLSAPARVGRFFDSEGNAVYASEEERLKGRAKKVTLRLAAKARRRTRKLALAYAASMVLAFGVIGVQAQAVAEVVQ